jgi:hypothetical protein
MIQWALKQSNMNRSLLHLVLAKVFPQRNIGWFCLMAGKLLELGLRYPITYKFEEIPFNIFRIHLGFQVLTRDPLLNQRKLPPAVPLPLLLTLLQLL